jgi:hypothetical protein
LIDDRDDYEVFLLIWEPSARLECAIMTSPRSKPGDLSLQLMQESPRVILVPEEGDAEGASRVEFEAKRPGVTESALPGWMATKRGFV